ncbi:MAG: Bug family tripartite tricarboxylate transporter substrate binding protein [Burkholderiales bacterium]
MKFFHSTGILVAAMLVSTVAFAQTGSYPSRPVRIIAPSGAGGPVDVVCRIVAQGLGDHLGQQVVVENRVGAAGLIGTEYVVRQRPDGYTLLFGFSGPLAIVPNLNPRTPYNVANDLVPIAQVATQPYVLLVHPSVPAKSVKELVALAKARPGKMNFSSGGVGVGIHMAGELFKVAAGVNLVHVPYAGAAPAMTALMSGEVDLMFNGLSPAVPHIRSGRVRALAVGGEKRVGLFSHLPTIQESGYAFKTGGWYGLLAPRGTPRPVVDTLHAAVVKTMEQASVRAALTKIVTEPVVGTPQGFAELINYESGQWSKVIKTAGIKVN